MNIYYFKLYNNAPLLPPFFFKGEFSPRIRNRGSNNLARVCKRILILYFLIEEPISKLPFFFFFKDSNYENQTHFHFNSY